MPGRTILSERAVDPNRYTLVRALGSGTSGSVYLAHDAETGGEVALKKLFKLDPKSVQRFKREFRSLTDLHHPNLVKLFDLQRGSDAWYLTMEYIEGTEFRPGALAGSTEPQTTREDALATREERLSSRADVDATQQVTVFDSQKLAELLRVFHELAAGIVALHRAGLLHRDLKPSNVLIARDGRVVVLDFGLVRELDEHAVNVTHDGTVAGTPAYMAPEQALAATLGEAADWYAFGVMLYESLSGVLPIDAANLHELLRLKLVRDPPALVARGLGVPEELVELCMQLLARTPEARPDGKRVLAVLTGLRGLPPALEVTSTERLATLTDVGTLRQRKRAPFVGREVAIAQLTAALAHACAERSIAVAVHGSSGAGKTALVEHFLGEVEQPGQPRPLTLRSRCYERESMPFKALDGVVDALVHYLAQVDDVVAAHLLPADFVELTQLFPAFQRLRAAQRLLVHKQPHPDATNSRQRAEQALRTLIDRVALRQPVVLWIDDLQWGDVDSANVLRDWFLEPRSAALMLIVTYRSEERETSTCLRVLESLLWAAENDDRGCVIALEAMRDTDIEVLCGQRSTVELPPAVVTRIVAESRGNPFWVLQLSALAEAKLGRGELDLNDISIRELVTRTSELLPGAAQQLLDVLAVAGRPLLPQLALRAADVGQDGRALMHELQGLRLIRAPVINGERLLEIYHDRVREAVQAALGDDARRRLHDRLLRVLEISGRADADWLHELALGAGEEQLALRYGLIAAERAYKSLAFERAIDLLQRCLRMSRDAALRAELRVRLAEALARSRRGAEAADVYLEAAEQAKPDDQLRLLQLAASHMLRTGRFEEGEQLVQRVLAAQHIGIPDSELGMYAAIGWERTRIAVLKTTFTPREPTENDAGARRLAELYTTFSGETQFYAPLRSAVFQSRALRTSLQLGDAALVARALCLTAAVSCLAGTERASRSADRQLEQAESLLAKLENYDLRAELLCARTICSFLLGKMTTVLNTAEAADAHYQSGRVGGERGDYYYLFVIQTARIGALQIFGHYRRAESFLREVLARALATANRTAMLQATLVRTQSELYRDYAHESRPRLDREREELPKHGIGILHMLHLTAVLRAAALTFDFDWAFAVMDQLWERCMQSPLRHGSLLRYFMHSSRARLLLNRYVVEGRKGDPGAIVEEDLRALRSLQHLPIQNLSRNFDARIAYLRGDTAGAIEAAQIMMRGFEQRQLLEEMAREKQALGCLIGGEEGAQLRAAGHAESLALGVANPFTLLRASNPELVIDFGLAPEVVSQPRR
ncbi:MAG: protein kinase [Polyangiales bacterium]